MKCRSKKSIKLTKFGKIFFSSIALVIIGIFSIVFQSGNDDSNDKYIFEINYPKLQNKAIAKAIKKYIDEKKENFVKETEKYEIDDLENDSNFKYEFLSDYEISDASTVIGVHININEYTGGAHYIKEDKSYYFDKEREEEITIKDILENDNSLEKLSNKAFYYVMKYGEDNNLSFDEVWVNDGTRADYVNYNYFNLLDDGLEIVFVPYQVSCYADGYIHIVIPYGDLLGIIKDNYIPKEEKEEVPRRSVEDFKDKKLIAFTFDDGPSGNTDKLLDHLDEHNARVTFFVMGNRVLKYRDIVKRAYDMGNLIGSHTYSHKNLLHLSKYETMKEIYLTDKNIQSIINITPIYLRPPYGNIDANIRSIANRGIIMWDLDTEDWKNKNKNKIVDYIVNNAHDGGIVLLHDLYEVSVDAALEAMEILEEKNYAFVTIEEMIRIKEIELDNDKNYYRFID